MHEAFAAANHAHAAKRQNEQRRQNGVNVRDKRRRLLLFKDLHFEREAATLLIVEGVDFDARGAFFQVECRMRGEVSAIVCEEETPGIKVVVAEVIRLAFLIHHDLDVLCVDD